MAPCEFATLTASDLGWVPEGTARGGVEEEGEDGADEQS